MENVIKLKGLLIDVDNIEVKTVEIDYHPGTGYNDFKEIIKSNWIRHCNRFVNMVGDVCIIHDDNGFSKPEPKPSYIAFENLEPVSVIVGNIFICKIGEIDIEYQEFESLTDKEIELIYQRVINVKNDNGNSMVALCADLNNI